MNIHAVTFTLLIVGGLNWLAVGLFGWDLGMLFGGQTELISRVIYVLVGVSAIYEIFGHKGICGSCAPGQSM